MLRIRFMLQDVQFVAGLLTNRGRDGKAADPGRPDLLPDARRRSPTGSDQPVGGTGPALCANRLVHSRPWTLARSGYPNPWGTGSWRAQERPWPILSCQGPTVDGSFIRCDRGGQNSPRRGRHGFVSQRVSALSLVNETFGGVLNVNHGINMLGPVTSSSLISECP